MLSKRNCLIALFVWLALAQGCTQRNEPTSNLTLAFEVSPLPARTGPTMITLRMTDASGKAVTGARLTLEGNMSHPGMAPVFAEARETEPGRYESVIDLSMAGDWYVLAHVILADGRKLDQQFDIKGVAETVSTVSVSGSCPNLRMLFPGTAGVSPALSAKREKRARQARRLRSQERACSQLGTPPVSAIALFGA